MTEAVHNERLGLSKQSLNHIIFILFTFSY